MNIAAGLRNVRGDIRPERVETMSTKTLKLETAYKRSLVQG